MLPSESAQLWYESVLHQTPALHCQGPSPFQGMSSKQLTAAKACCIAVLYLPSLLL